MSPKARVQKRLYYKIGEACKALDIQPYVLRYWETEFPQLQPERRSGHRLYRRKDVETVFAIKRLLYEEGFTIEGARKHLSGNAGESQDDKALQRSALNGMHLKAIKRELEGILTILSRKS